MTTLSAEIGQGVAVDFTLPTTDALTAATWWLEDADAGQIISPAAITLAGLSPGLVQVVVPGTAHAEPGFRLARLRWSTATKGGVAEIAYQVLSAHELVIQVNSFAGYNRLVDLAYSIHGLDAFAAADRVTRVRALATAWRFLVGLNITDTDISDRQNRINDVPWAGGSIDLTDLSASELLLLEPRMLEALRRAQVVEADELITGGGVDASRQAGLLSSSIGETSQMYRSGKPIQRNVSARALRELNGYISYARRIGRA